MTPDPGPIARTTVVLLAQSAAQAHRAQHPTIPVDPRLIAAEVVAACALHLVMQWSAWQALNTAALAADQQEGAALELMRELAAIRATPTAMHDALSSLELLDAAVRAWAPHAHPAITAREAMRTPGT